MRKLTTQEFIERARSIHGDRYDYQKVAYVNNSTKVEIICKEHGSFLQMPSKHLIKSGCPKCNKKFKISTEVFLERIKKIHGNKYDYSKIEYVNNKTKVEIICKEHGLFSQIARIHLIGGGCPKCARNIKKTIEEFVEEANKIHNNKYDYSNSKYKNDSCKIEIICKIHKSFFQTPSSHLRGNGCAKCYHDSKKMTTKDFIDKSNVIHDYKYNYQKVEYINNNTKVEIICKEHGTFTQSASSHLMGHGCSSCNKSISKKETEWLDYLNIPKEFRQIKLKINNKIIKADAVDLNNKIVYEFFGDYWHGNPSKYNPNDINKNNKKTFEELYNSTLDKINFIKKNNYKIIYIWESEWEKIKKTMI